MHLIRVMLLLLMGTISMIRFARWAAVVAIAVSAPAQAASISGTYVGKGPDMAVLLQLVETSDGQLTGRYQQVRLLPGPKIDQFNATVKGSVGGETVVLEVKPTELLAGTIVMSGTIASSGLRLTGGGNGITVDLPLSKASEVEFKNQVAAFNSQISQITAARSLESDTKQLETVLKRMTAFSSRTDVELKKFPPIKERFQAQTRAMSTALTKQQSILQIDRTAVDRGQFNIAINQANVEFDQLRLSLQTARSDFEGKSGQLLQEAVSLHKKCQSPSDERESVTPSMEAWKSLCRQLPSVGKNFSLQLKRLIEAFGQAEAVWQEESRKQTLIVKSSDTASR